MAVVGTSTCSSISRPGIGQVVKKEAAETVVVAGVVSVVVDSAVALHKYSQLY